REALRILEAEGLLSVRRGKLGGAVVHLPRPRDAAYTLDLVLKAEQATLADVGIALQQLEPACAALCAERVDRELEVLPRLELAHRRAAATLDSSEADYIEQAGRFHAELVSCCGNITLVVVAGALESIWLARTHAVLRD